MDENIENNISDVNSEVEVDSETDFDNLTILKELSNIVNLIGDEEFLEMMPKSFESRKRVKWVPMFNCLKASILDEMVQEMSAMWRCEEMPRKLAVLDMQKERFADKNIDMWRPQLGDVQSQLRAIDAASLRERKERLEKQAAEYEARVKSMKKVISAKRSYLIALDMDMQKCLKKNKDIQALMKKRIIDLQTSKTS